MSSPLVTVTVCARNASAWVDACMEALTSQSYPSIEVVAINDGSTDDTGDRMEAWKDEQGQRGPPVRVHHQDALGLSAGRHRALEDSNGEWVAITDIDVRPEPDWIENLMTSSTPVDDREQVVAVTGRTVFERAEDLVSWHRSVEISSKYRSRPRRTNLANGPCSMFHRETLVGVGGFGADWYHAEDMEVSLRLVQSGGVIVYAPLAVVRHVPETGLRRFLHKRARDARAHVRIVRKYPRKDRQGHAFDFLGSSSRVLLAVPWCCALLAWSLASWSVAGSTFMFLNIDGEVLKWAVMMILLLIQQVTMWRGPLGAVNREVLNHAPLGRLRSFALLHWMILSWSVSLWYGSAMGAIDALLGRNGH